MKSKEKDQTTEAPAANAKNTDKKLLPLPILAAAANIPDWELAALMQASGWADGKELTAAEFGAALAKLRKRPQGGGKI